MLSVFVSVHALFSIVVYHICTYFSSVPATTSIQVEDSHTHSKKYPYYRSVRILPIIKAKDRKLTKYQLKEFLISGNLYEILLF